MSVRFAMILLVLTGCDQVWGLERGTKDATDVSRVVSGRVVRRFLSNDSSLHPVVETVPYLAADAPHVRFRGQDIAVGWSAAEGIFTFTVPGAEPYQLRFGDAEYQLASDSISLDETIPGHADAVAPDQATILTIHPIPAFADAADVYVITTGVFSVTRPITVSSSEYRLAWSGADFQGRPGGLDAAANDRGWLARYEYEQDYERMTQVAPFMLTMTDPGEYAVTAPVSTLSEKLCAGIDAPLGGEAARLLALHPMYLADIPQWALYSVPRSEYGMTAAFTLAHSNVLEADVQFGTPFQGHDTILSYIVRAQSTKPLGGYTAIYYYDRIADPTTCTPHTIPLGLVIPMQPMLARVPLADGVVVGMAAGESPVVTWDDSSGALASTGYVVQLLDSTATTVVLQTIHTAERRAVLDPLLLANDRTYKLVIVGSNQQPDIATGDFTKRVLPYGLGVLVTGPFSVSR